MIRLRTFALVAAVAAALAVTADSAQAGPPCNGCGHSGGLFSGLGSGFGGGAGGGAPRTLFGSSHKNLPAFQAAPWYLYWPYDAHFLTPAPVTGAFYGPPQTGNFPVNPYFPAAQGGYGYGGYGFGGPMMAPPQAMPPR